MGSIAEVFDPAPKDRLFYNVYFQIASTHHIDDFQAVLKTMISWLSVGFIRVGAKRYSTVGLQ